MTFVLKGTIGIYLYLIAVIALIETIIQLIRIIRLAATSREKKVAKQKKHKRNENFVFTDDVLSGDYQDEIEFVSPQIDEAQPAASKPVYAAAATDGDGFADIWQGDLDAELQDSYNKEEEASAATSEGEDASMQDGPKQEEEQPRTVIYTAKTVYNGPRDAFIDTLADEQKVEFYKVFLEKSRGNLPPVPVYILNGKNESFFQSIFVHLNSFRDLISDGLLDKIYQQVINLR
jgi:hypothetical protein